MSDREALARQSTRDAADERVEVRATHLLDPQSDRTVYEAMAEQGAFKQLEAG